MALSVGTWEERARVEWLEEEESGGRIWGLGRHIGRAHGWASGSKGWINPWPESLGVQNSILELDAYGCGWAYFQAKYNELKESCMPFTWNRGRLRQSLRRVWIQHAYRKANSAADCRARLARDRDSDDPVPSDVPPTVVYIKRWWPMFYVAENYGRRGVWYAHIILSLVVPHNGTGESFIESVDLYAFTASTDIDSVFFYPTSIIWWYNIMIY